MTAAIVRGAPAPRSETPVVPLLTALRDHLALAAEARRRGDHAAADAHERDALLAARADERDALLAACAAPGARRVEARA